MRDFIKKIKGIIFRYQAVVITYLLLQFVFVLGFIFVGMLIKSEILKWWFGILDISIVQNINADVIKYFLLLIPLYLFFIFYRQIFLEAFFLLSYKNWKKVSFLKVLLIIISNFRILVKKYFISNWLTILRYTVFWLLILSLFLFIWMWIITFILSFLAWLYFIYYLFKKQVYYPYWNLYIIDRKKSLYKNLDYTLDETEKAKHLKLIISYYKFLLFIFIFWYIVSFGDIFVDFIGSDYAKIYIYSLFYILYSIFLVTWEALFSIYVAEEKTKNFLQRTNKKELVKDFLTKKQKKSGKIKIIFKYILFLFIIILPILVFLWLSSYIIIEAINESNNKKIVYQAHRGFSEINVQNTLKSFTDAIWKADYVELDVQITKDNKIIVFHDENFESLTWEVWIVSQRNLDEIKTYKLKEFKIKLGKEIYWKISTLDEVLKEISSKIKVNIEIKNTNPKKIKELVKNTLEVIKKYKKKDNIVISSLDYEVLKEVRRQNKNIKIGLISSVYLWDIMSYDVDFYSTNWAFVEMDLIDEIHEWGRKIYVWTFSLIWDVSFSENLFSWVDGFIVDNPEEFRKHIEDLKKQNIKIKFDFLSDEAFPF